MKHFAIAFLFVLGFSLLTGCAPDIKGYCYSNEECIEGYLCNKDKKCIQVDQENIEILTSSLDDAVFGEVYSEELSLRGGLAPYTWSVVSGPGWMKTEKDTKTGIWRLNGVPETYQKDEVIVELEVTDSSIGVGQKATSINLSIRVPYCLTSECSDHGTCNAEGVCECDLGYAGNKCEGCDLVNGYKLNNNQECVRYKYKCEPAEVCGAGVLKCECVDQECEEVKDCNPIQDCAETTVCWVNGTEYKCDDCQGYGCTNGVCNGCSEGACCNNGNIQPDTVTCDSWTEYQCSSTTTCGASVQERSVEQFCSGTTSDCDGGLVPSGWSTFQQCDELTEICENDGSTFASCNACGSNKACDEGQCHDIPPEGCETIVFNDSAIEAAVRQAIGKAEGDILYDDILTLTKLDVSASKITDIGGIQCLTNLTFLDLGYNPISDISPLANLTNLTVLYLYGNQIIDISSLANLTNLTALYLYGNQISDISSLANLTNLTALGLYKNQISDISILENLSNLTELNLGNNQISDISVLANLTELTYLNLSIIQISDISPLANLINLTELYLGSNQISDISVMANLTNLTELHFVGNQIIDIGALENLTNLTKLYLQANQITDISPLANMTNLTRLSLNSNQISDINPLANLTGLTWLNLSDNQISDISPLVDNTDINSGDEVNIANNPQINCTDQADNIAALRNRGVDLTTDCP